MGKIVGIKKVDFTDNQGKAVKGYKFHILEEEEGVIGKAAISFFMTSEKAEPIVCNFPSLDKLLGKEVNVVYNRFGKVASVTMV